MVHGPKQPSGLLKIHQLGFAHEDGVGGYLINGYFAKTQAGGDDHEYFTAFGDLLQADLPAGDVVFELAAVKIGGAYRAINKCIIHEAAGIDHVGYILQGYPVNAVAIVYDLVIQAGGIFLCFNIMVSKVLLDLDVFAGRLAVHSIVQRRIFLFGATGQQA